MKVKFLLSLGLVGLTIPATAQLSAPEPEGVFGGRINAISGHSYTADSTRVYIATESANSVFYADVYSTVAAHASSNGFEVMPALDASAGFGGGIRVMAGHEASNSLFFVAPSGIRRTSASSSSTVSITTGMVQDMIISGNNMAYISGNQVHFGSLNSSGAFTADANSPITISAAGSLSQLAVNSGNLLYVLESGNSPQVYKSNDALGFFTAGTSFSSVSLTGFSATVDWKSIGFSSSDRLFVGGDTQNPPVKSLRYTDNELVWVDVVLPSTPGAVGEGVAGTEIAGGLNNHVYWGSIYSADNGITFNKFGNISQETNPNDGDIYVLPGNDSIVLLTTDMGIAASVDAGANIAEINDGVLAVQVNDFDMSSDKNHGWAASKSGIRSVHDYLGAKNWSNAMYPTGDGSPYYSVEMESDDSARVYAGNVRVYKTTNAGASWQQVFTPESAPYNFQSFNCGAYAIETCPWDSSIVMAGYTVFDSDKGGLFYSHDAGTTWQQLHIEVSTDGFDVDVNDIVFNLEGADTVAYIGVSFDVSSPQGFSVYRAVKAGSSWTVNQNMDGTNTSTGTSFVVSIEDLEVYGDTILAVGTDAGNNHPTAYYKVVSGSNVWTPFGTSGFPFVSGKKGAAITVGNDTIYCAVDHEIYYRAPSTSAWQLGYSYPVGTKIQFLYFDDLLAGTDYGLYEHKSQSSISIVENPEFLVEKVYPNPATDFVNIQLNSGKESTLKVFNSQGKLMHTVESSTANIQLDLSSLSAGLYIIQVSNSEGESSLKLLKQ